MQLIEEFKLRQCTVICPVCTNSFATPQLARKPLISTESPIETDLHRILPSSAIRAALLGSCPKCGHTWWMTAFRSRISAADTYAPPESLEPSLDHPRKFAAAFYTGKQEGAQPRELALIAMNGAWCSREAELSCDRWLDLARSELEVALSDRTWTGNRGYYYFLIAEVARQQGDYKEAIDYLDRVTYHSRLPRELILRQKVQCIAACAEPTLLPPYLVELIFFQRGMHNPPTLQSES